MIVPKGRGETGKPPNARIEAFMMGKGLLLVLLDFIVIEFLIACADVCG
jgi:hypothetical protein